MRKIIPAVLERGRVRSGQLSSNSSFGLHEAFMVDSPWGQTLGIIATDGTDPEALGWEHVSVSCRNRCPNWPEMSFVKDLFWSEDECVLQFHPPKSVYVNAHPNVLHLWKPVEGIIETPPIELIGPMEATAS